jgi:hypothetical protein
MKLRLREVHAFVDVCAFAYLITEKQASNVEHFEHYLAKVLPLRL